MIRNFPYLNKLSNFLLFASFLLLNSTVWGQNTVTIPGTIQGTASGVLGTTTAYAVNESLYLDSEIGAGPSNSTLLSLAIRTNVGFPATPVGNNVFNNVRISVKEVPATTVSLAAGVYSLAGYTTVFSGTITASTVQVTNITIPFSTPFPRTAGMNLMVMIERLDGTAAHSTGNWQVITGANTATPMARRYTGAAAPVLGTTNITTLFPGRSVVAFTYDVSNPTVNLDNVYTLGSLPIPYGTPHTIQANVSNNSAAKAYNVKAYLNITGVNTKQDTITIDSINPYSRRVVDFPAYTPTNYGVNTVNVKIDPPTGGFAVKTTYSMDQTITSNIYSLAYGFNGNPPVATNGVGFNGGTGDFVAKFYTDSPSKVNQVVVNIYSATSGPQPFKVGIWGDSGTGTPGALLWESAQLSSSPGKFTVPVTPKVALAGNTSFFVGVRQLGTTNISFAYQTEAPPRIGNFYYTAPSGNTNWVDFAATNSGFRFLAEARLELANDVGVAQLTYPSNATVYSVCDSIAPIADIVNYGIFDQVDVPVTMTILDAGIPIYTQTVIIPSLTSGQVLPVVFPKYLFPPNTATYTATCTTGLAGDQDTSNDGLPVPPSFSFGQYAYGTDILNNSYNFANSSACAAAAPNGQPTYGWISPTGMQQVALPTNADDVYAGPFQLPAAFYFFGTTSEQFWVSSNGFITFTDPAVFTNVGFVNDGAALNIPTVGGLDNYIAGALTDLDFSAGKYPDAQIYYGQNPNNLDEFVITFWHAHKFYTTLPTTPEYVTFQIILTNNKYYPFKIQFNALESSTPLPTSITNLCTIGAESSTGTNGILYRRFGGRGPMFDNPSLAFQATLKDSTIVKLTSKVFLHNVDQSTGLMTEYLNTLTNFPLSDPYAATGAFNGNYTHVDNGPTQATTAFVLGTNVFTNDAIVDWVFIELRQGQSGSTQVIHTQAALLQADGDIVDTDGISPITFPTALPGKYYVAIRHRNHLGFRTANLIDVVPNTSLNLSNNTIPLYGATPQFSKTPTLYAMLGGDANSDGSIDAFDTIDWELQNGLFDDYTNNADYNADGSVDAFDTIYWELNNGTFQDLD